jgi:Mor family transcriptional regulator
VATVIDLAVLTSAERPDLSELTAPELAPLERLFDPLTPDTWRDLARSQYVTLRTLSGRHHADAELAALALELTKGIAADMGGTQPYIQAGSQLLASARARKVIELRNQGKGYREVAHLCGKITEARVRQIETAWVREQRALRQGQLDLV